MASQVNHFKEFATQADYEAYIQPDDYTKPLVALVEATGTVMFPQGGGGGGGCGNPIMKTVDVEDFTGTELGRLTSYITDVNIPDTVTSIGNSAFSNCTSLTSVDIPSTVTSIGNSAFYGCTSLTSMDIPSGVTSIGDSVFYNCTSLTSVDMQQSGVTMLNNYTFLGCNHLLSIILPSTVTRINNQAFYDCTAMTSFTILSTTPPTLPTHSSQLANVLPWYNTGFTVYVPAESVDTYKAASGWSAYASKIQAIPATP